MALTEDMINKLKELIYENQDFEAIKLIKKETDLSYDDATEYVHRLKESLGKNSAKRTVKRNSRINLYVFAGLSGLFWILAIVFYISKTNQIERSILVKGNVTDMVRDEEGSAPVVTYYLGEVTYEYKSNVYSTPPAYEVGDIVELYVNEADRNEVMINSFVDRWLVILILVTLGVAFDIAAVLALKTRWRYTGSKLDLFEEERNKIEGA